MNAFMLLGIAAGLTLGLALLFRVSAVYVFLSIAAGSLLVQYVADDTSLALEMAFRGQPTIMIAQVGLQVLPVLLTLLWLRKSLPKAGLILHIVPLILCSLSLAVLLLPFLDTTAQAQLYSTFYGDKLKDAQDVIVGAAVLSVLALIWVTGRTKDHGHKKHKISH